MSEGPEVKITADKICNALSDKRAIQGILHNKIDKDTKSKIIGSSMEHVKTFGKNIVVKFSSGVYLRNHMMMWGRWRIYDRESTTVDQPNHRHGMYTGKTRTKMQTMYKLNKIT